MNAERFLYRFVFIKVGAVALSGEYPLETGGFFEGHVVSADPETDKDGNVVDYMLRVKLRAAPAKRAQIVSISANNKGWRFRFPRKGE